tara:strand:- start:145 stop:285 length:141 start_codon:yes stop_codon:yes gene_type:complete
MTSEEKDVIDWLEKKLEDGKEAIISSFDLTNLNLPIIKKTENGLSF